MSDNSVIVVGPRQSSKYFCIEEASNYKNQF